ncbi:hypothetical protein QKU58_gp052 [Pyramimonas orientalis virus]|uniref:Uncharacterized protein n=1 Tax=Pyramimonas orientalis virus 01B TaxID=3134525 RepID=A0A7L9AXI9_9VIRU|nr:hypothetical protein QKU58_gp052 [Pyramimonas orientalis virus]QOI90279.1 hypothetical protein HWQ62_00142 [Pyramimonas orientalis virus]
MKHLTYIENIFHKFDIYKSIFVCKANHLNDYYHALRKYDYPVCKIINMHDFNNHISRVLLIDEYDVQNFSLIEPDLLLNEVNMVLCIDNTLKIKQLENVPHIFL